MKLCGVVPLQTIANHNCGYYYEQSSDLVAYWVSKALLHDFEIGKRLESIALPRQKIKTSDKYRFLCFWFEVENTTVTRMYAIRWMMNSPC